MLISPLLLRGSSWELVRMTWVRNSPSPKNDSILALSVRTPEVKTQKLAQLLIKIRLNRLSYFSAWAWQNWLQIDGPLRYRDPFVLINFGDSSSRHRGTRAKKCKNFENVGTSNFGKSLSFGTRNSISDSLILTKICEHRGHGPPFYVLKFQPPILNA